MILLSCFHICEMKIMVIVRIKETNIYMLYVLNVFIIIQIYHSDITIVMFLGSGHQCPENFNLDFIVDTGTLVCPN